MGTKYIGDKMTGLRNTQYLESLFNDYYELSEATGLSLSICRKLFYAQAFQPMTIHLQALIKAGVDLNEYLTVKIEA